MSPKSPLPGVVAPPEPLALGEGQRVLSKARDTLALDMDRQIMQQKAILDNTQLYLASDIDLSLAKAEVAREAARQQLDHRINLVLGNAIGLSAPLGIELPSPSEIRTRTVYPPPDIVYASPGNSPNPLIDGASPYGGWNSGGQSPAEQSSIGDSGAYSCSTESLPEAERENFRFIWYRGLDVNSVVIAGSIQLPHPFVAGPIYPKWYHARLACHLVNVCGWDRSRLDRHMSDISSVLLAGPGQYPIQLDMSGICDFVNENWL